MSTFEAAIPVVLMHEGGWVNDPNDLGAETNFGISTLIIKRIQARLNLTDTGMEQWLGITPGTIYKPGYMKTANGFTIDRAKAIYHSEFWLALYEGIQSQTAATKIFDFAVNAGQGHAIPVAQKAANNCGQNVFVDGALGPATVAAINASGTAFIQAMANEMSAYYKQIVVNRPQNAKFLPNWLHRAAWGVAN